MIINVLAVRAAAAAFEIACEEEVTGGFFFTCQQTKAGNNVVHALVCIRVDEEPALLAASGAEKKERVGT
jgi:hypothetical protein